MATVKLYSSTTPVNHQKSNSQQHNFVDTLPGSLTVRPAENLKVSKKGNILTIIFPGVNYLAVQLREGIKKHTKDTGCHLVPHLIP